MQKLFNRKKKHNDVDSSTKHPSPHSDRSDPRMHSSLYDSSPVGGLPQTGHYPIKGNDTANVLKKKPSRRSSFRSWRSSSGSQQPALFNRSPTPDQYGRRGIAASSPSSDMMRSEAYTPQPGVSRRRSRTQLPQEFSYMNLANEALPTTTTTTTTTTGPLSTIHSSHGLPSGPTAAHQIQLQTQPQPQRQSNAPVNPKRSSIQTVSPSDMQGAYSSSQRQTQSMSQYAATPSDTQGRDVSNESPVSPLESRSKHSVNRHGKQSRQSEFDGGVTAKSKIITRKDVGTTSARNSGGPTHAQQGHGRDMSSDKALPFMPSTSRSKYESSQTGISPASVAGATGVLDRNRPIPKGSSALDPQVVMDRAKMNTTDTSVIEKYAPAVVHETVHKDIHHAREEVIEREIHTHDVYHRILPVIDVEVLPARHFLPVEGGGLVEINAVEVPGRGNNWVLAETISRIPSDQAAPGGATNFTARTFPNREGDEVRYITSEGYEKAEQTWVHPPELETGARDTGQSWPMVFGEEVPEKGTYGYNSPKNSKKMSWKHADTSSASAS